LPLRRIIVLFVLLAGIFLGWRGWQSRTSQQQVSAPPAVTIIKQPVVFANRTFDPAAPPADMPPLGPGESAECDSNFASNASVAGTSRKEDSTHAILTITQVNVTLQLNINIWVPNEVTQHVIEHEEGHRQISEYYYQTADKIAERIASAYIGKQIEVTGTYLDGQASKMLQQSAADITNEYGKELSPGPTQLLYDDITDHSRNEIVAKDAVTSAINDAAIASIQPSPIPSN